MSSITVLYPAAPDATFDMDYYMKTHMPLVMDSWKEYGLESWTVTRFTGTLSGDPAPYTVQAVLHFKGPDDNQKAVKGPHAEKVFGDVPNFSNKGPMGILSEAMGSSGS